MSIGVGAIVPLSRMIEATSEHCRNRQVYGAPLINNQVSVI